MRTLHVGLRVEVLDRSLEFYENLGYDVVGTVPETEFGGLTMLKLPRDPFVSLELVQWPPARSDGLISADSRTVAASDGRPTSSPSYRYECVRRGPGAVGVSAHRPIPLSAVSPLARRMFDLVEPIGVIPYSADEPNEAMFALGFTNYWDTYFAGRAAPLGSSVPAGVVHALFYNFGPGEVARHIPKVWATTTPEAAIAARQQGCVHALRRILGDLIDTPDFTRAVELLTKAATSAPLEGRPMYAALRALPLPQEPVARLFHAASLLREHRGDGHIAALMAEGIGGLEAHVLLALDLGIPAPTFGRIHHLPSALLTDLINGMKAQGLIRDEKTFTPAGRKVKNRVETLTDDLAVVPYEVLETTELDELIAALEPLAQKLIAAQDWG